MTGAVSIDGQEPRLKTALQSFMTPEFVGACRQLLIRRLTGGAQQDPKECEECKRKLSPSQEKLSRIIAGSGSPEDVLEARDQEGGLDRFKTRRNRPSEKRAAGAQHPCVRRPDQGQTRGALGLALQAIPKSKLHAILSRRFPVGGRWLSFDGTLLFAPWVPLEKWELTRRKWSDDVEAIIEEELGKTGQSIYKAWTQVSLRCKKMGLSEDEFPRRITLFKRVNSRPCKTPATRMNARDLG